MQPFDFQAHEAEYLARVSQERHEMLIIMVSSVLIFLAVGFLLKISGFLDTKVGKFCTKALTFASIAFLGYAIARRFKSSK